MRSIRGAVIKGFGTSRDIYELHLMKLNKNMRKDIFHCLSVHCKEIVFFPSFKNIHNNMDLLSVKLVD